MIAEIGHFSLWLALGLAFMQALGPWMGLSQVARPAALGQALCCLLAFGALGHAFFSSDFSVALVYQHSHSAKPLLYKITGLWGNHEGSLLLWVLMLALSSAALAVGSGGHFQARILSVQAMIGVGFYALLLFTSNPFARLTPAPLEGVGLNPILQDIGLALHPPLLYAGYVGMSVAFSFAVAGLIERRIDPAWARLLRPWVLAAWAFLTLGLALGSWWAYYELGWGGWWFWDPVENSALMPWLAATALFHSARVLETRDALRTWTALLAVLAFCLSMLGTFIVRSGILTSVHSFAVDPERGLFILGLLAVYIGGALTLFAVRGVGVPVGQGLRPISREGALVANNLLLAAGLGTVFIGTLYPLFLEAVTGTQITVGPPYFTATFVPLMVPLIVLMGVGPLLPWGRPGKWARLAIPAVLTLLALVTVAALQRPYTVLALGGFGLAAWLAASTALLAVRRSRRWGLIFGHGGVALLVFGMTAVGVGQQEVLVPLRVGQSVALAGFTATLMDISPVAGPNFTALEGKIRVQNARKEDVALLTPQARHYANPPMDTTEAGIVPLWSGDLYAALGMPDGTGRWQVRLYYKPFIPLIWIGAAVMALGGAVAIRKTRGVS